MRLSRTIYAGQWAASLVPVNDFAPDQEIRAPEEEGDLMALVFEVAPGECIAFVLSDRIRRALLATLTPIQVARNGDLRRLREAEE